MRLLSFLNNGRETWGAIVGDGVVDLGSKLSHATLQDFIASADFDKRDRIVAGFKPDLKLADIKYLPVIPRPEKIVCAVRNYLDHHQEAVAPRHAAGDHGVSADLPAGLALAGRPQRGR